MLLSKEQILSADDRKKIVVDVPEWGGEVTLIEPSAKDVDDIQDGMMNVKSDGTAVSGVEMDGTNIRAKTVVRCILNADGTRMFQDDEAAMLGNKSDMVIDRLYNLLQELQEDTESAEKNSETDQS